MTTAEILAGFLDGLRPTERLRPTDWADEYRFLSSAASAEPGRWRTSRTPYLAEIMDCFDPYSPVEEVIFPKGAQIGASEAGFNIVGYFIDIAPCPIMYVMPTEGTIKRNSKMRLAPMIEASPRLRSKVSEAKSRDSGNTILQKDFPGGTLLLAGANSASGLRSVPVRVLILDEVDAFPLDLDGEGSPVSLAKARTRTFSGRKIFQLSTPTLERTSTIAAEYATTDRRKYHVPCPHCQATQEITWEKIKFDRKKTPVVEALMECEHCHADIEERHKPWMLKHGTWVATSPENDNPKRRGYHLSGLYSPLGWFSWADAANQFIDATKRKDENALKVFVNTVLGETWKEKITVPEYSRLFERRGGYRSGEAPQGVAVLTAGCDVQEDRIEVEVVGWGEGLRAWSLAYQVLHGNTSQPAVWDALQSFLGQGFTRPDGSELGISRTCVDAGYNTTHVYKFCRRVGASIAAPVKGSSGGARKTFLNAPTTVDIRETGKRVGRTSLWTLSVDIGKAELYGWLNLEMSDTGETPPGYCFFPEDYPIEYFQMLTAENLEERKTPKGYTDHVWVKARARNEALDCRVYARAALAILGADRWEAKHWRAAAARPLTPKRPSVSAQLAAAAPIPDTTEVATSTPQPVAREAAQSPARQRKKGDFW